MNLVLNYVVDYEVWGIKPDYRFLVTFYLNSKHDRLSALIDQTDYFAEVLVLHLYAQDAPVYFLSFPVAVVLQPLELVLNVWSVLIISAWSDQVADEADDARGETGFREQVHLQLL